MITGNENNEGGNHGTVVEAYSTGIKAEILWDDTENVWYVDYHIPGLMYYGPYGTTIWTLHEEPDDDTFSTGYYEYPLGEFAAFVAEYKGTDTNHGHGLPLFDIATSDDMEMPDNLDVTEYYVRSEKVMDILCDVYQAHDLTYEVDLTFWVDPATGLTLKYKCEGRAEEEYEVTKLILDTPDWDELRLRPQDGDTILEGA